MADIRIPNLNKNSEKFIFKKKLTLRRKSKKKLIKESFFMFSFACLIIYLNYLIPDKNLIFINFAKNLKNTFVLILELISYFYEIGLVILVICSLMLSFILFLGVFSRVSKIMKRKSKQISFK